jgi:hypothetical protein
MGVGRKETHKMGVGRKEEMERRKGRKGWNGNK